MKEDNKVDFICSKELRGKDKCKFQCSKCWEIEDKVDKGLPPPKKK